MKITIEKDGKTEDAFQCITDFTIPPSHKHFDELTTIQEDALACLRQHATLCSVNPRAKDSYDAQLAETLEKLNQHAENLQ